MSNNRYIISITVFCFILGSLLSLQYKSIKSHQDATESAAGIQRAEQLVAEINMLKDDNLLLQNKLEENERRIKEYEQALVSEDENAVAISKELEDTRRLAGLSAVTGPGLIVTLFDSTKDFDANVDINALLIHDEDILSVINELNAADCEAISINGQRFVSTSSVRCIGSLVMVNGTKIASPFEITAIGDGTVMEAALRIRGGVIDSLAPWGIEVKIEKYNDLVVPKYDGTYDYTYDYSEYNEVMRTAEK